VQEAVMAVVVPFKVAPGFECLLDPLEDLGEGITVDHLYPPDEIAELRAHGLTDDAILELSPEQVREILAKLDDLSAADDRPSLKPDRDEAEGFLAALDPATDRFTFQTFDDNEDRKDKSLARVLHGTLAQHFKTLAKLNNRGAGIFVCVNVTDFKGRSAKNIVSVRAHFGDLDGAPLDPVLAPGEPKTHLITETSPGRFHPYYRVVGAPLDQFSAVQKAIAARYDGDPSVNDLPRVMRLAGFIHRKGTPFLSRLVQTSDHEPYEWSEFCKAFDSSEQLDLTQKSAGGNGGEAPNRFKVAEEFKHLDPGDDLGEGLRDPHAEPGLIAAALAVIPRNDTDPHSDNYWNEIEQAPGRDYMVKIGMAVKAASNDSAEGRTLFASWRKGAPDYNADTFKKKWEGFHPTSIGFGTLSFYADKAHPGWREEYEARADGGGDTTNDVPGFNTSTDVGQQNGQSSRGKPPLIIELGSRLWGPPTKTGNEYRFGMDQSKVIDLRKGYWFDFATNEGGGIRELMKKVNTAANHTNIPPITYVDISKWIGAPVPQRLWAVLNRVPATNVTVLSGTGGIGKTILAMMLAASTILSREWFGVIPDQGPVIFVSGEEDEKEMHRRFADIVQHLDVSFQDLLNGGLYLIDKAGRNAMLACPDSSGMLITTPFLEQLSAEACRLKPKLVILDNRNMVYGGNINDPTQVSSFINTLRGFAIDANTAVILILHPSMAGIAAAADSSHQGLAGVMNWHDLPRGRMFFNRIKTNEDKEIDKDLRQLVCKKNNYGPDDETITLRWKTGTNGSGVFIMEPKPGSLEAMAANKKVEEIFLSSLQRLNDQNRGPFSHKKKSYNYAPTVLADLPEVKAAGIKKAALADAMDRLINAKKITIEPYGAPSKDWTKLVIQAESQTEKLAAILAAWKAAIDINVPRSLTHVIEMANPRINPELNTAFLAVAAMDDGTTINNAVLTRWLQKHHRNPAAGLMLSSDDGTNWTLLPAPTPFLPTRAIREQLHQCGLSDGEIAQLTSEQAQNIIRERLPQADYFEENR
jgi:RecA-family ATPase